MWSLHSTFQCLFTRVFWNQRWSVEYDRLIGSRIFGSLLVSTIRLAASWLLNLIINWWNMWSWNTECIRWKKVQTGCEIYMFFNWASFFMARHPLAGLDLLVVEVLRSQSGTPHTVGGPLDEWSACRIDVYLTKLNANNRQSSILPAWFEPATPPSERPQINDRDGSATGIGVCGVPSDINFTLLFYAVTEFIVSTDRNVLCLSNANIRSRAQKFPAWHTKVPPNGKCCEGYIVPSMVRLMYQLKSVLK